MKYALAIVTVFVSMPARAGEPTTASDEQVGRWIDELDSESFVRREQATARLAEAGISALAPLAAAAESGSLEVASRAVRLLMELARDEDTEVSLAALERIAKLPSRPVEQAAAESMLAGLREKHATDELSRLGAEFPRRYISAGQEVNPHLHLGEAFKGTDENMSLVKELKSLQMVTVHGSDISDEGIKPLAELKSLLIVQLYGTKATEAGVAALRLALPNADIQFRRGAFLGVQGSPNSDGTGAAISGVVEESAAANADLRVDDVITKFNDVKIQDFTGLTNEIAKCRPGDKANLEVRRGDQIEKKEVVFGKWR